MTHTNNSALVIFSGGQDSSTCLAWALNRFDTVYTLGFDYGQRHTVEMECRLNVRQGILDIADKHTQQSKNLMLQSKKLALWNKKLATDSIIPLDFFTHLGKNSLTHALDIPQNTAIEKTSSTETSEKNAIPNTFVPGRNLIFLTIAAAKAHSLNIRHIILGVCEADSSGYPDCSDDAMKSMQVTLNKGMDQNFVLHTPLMWLSKAEAWHLAEAEGGTELVDLILEESHTCYTGERSTRYPWGYGCGACPACLLRERGFAEYEQDKK